MKTTVRDLLIKKSLRIATLLGISLLHSPGSAQTGSTTSGKFSRIQGWTTITREDFLPYQLEIHRDIYYVGVEMAPRERVRLKVYEITPAGLVEDTETAVIQAPANLIAGEPVWIRVKGMKVGARYAVSFAPLSSRSGVRLRRFFDWGGVRRLSPTGSATGHPSSSPLSSPYTPAQPIQPSSLGGHRLNILQYPR